MNVTITPKENAALHALLSVVTSRMTDKKTEGLPFEMLMSVLTKLEAPEKEDTKTVTALKRALGAANVKSESFRGPLMTRMYEDTRIDEAKGMSDSEIKNAIKSLDSATVSVGSKKELMQFVGKVPEDTYAYQQKFSTGTAKDTDWFMIRGKKELDLTQVKNVTKMSDMKEQTVNEQGGGLVEIYKKDDTWHLRGMTDVMTKVTLGGIEANWKRGADKDGVVWTTENEQIAMGAVKSLGMSKKESKVFGATEYYVKEA
jgi:hypothetical protein